MWQSFDVDPPFYGSYVAESSGLAFAVRAGVPGQQVTVTEFDDGWKRTAGHVPAERVAAVGGTHAEHLTFVVDPYEGVREAWVPGTGPVPGPVVNSPAPPRHPLDPAVVARIERALHA